MEVLAMTVSGAISSATVLDFTTRRRISTSPITPFRTNSSLSFSSSHSYKKVCVRIFSPWHRASRSSTILVHCCQEGNGDGNRENIGNENSSAHHTSSSSNSASRPHGGGELDSLRRENGELKSALAALSQSLASISASLNDVSRAVQLLANAVEREPSSSSSSSSSGDAGFGAPTSAASSAGPILVDGLVDSVPMKSDSQELAPSSPDVFSEDEAAVPVVQDPVQARLLEENMRAHKLAFRLQQAFVQARIEGLGKPFQVVPGWQPSVAPAGLAAEDFVGTCLEAHAAGIGLKELQLQLILLEGALTGVFSIRNQRYSDNPVLSEESRVRSSWVRLVYTTLSEVMERRSRLNNVAGITSEDKEQPDPSDSFVKELVRLAYEEGMDLERIKLEQSVSEPTTSGAIKTMRQSTYLVLLTLQKATSDSLES